MDSRDGASEALTGNIFGCRQLQSFPQRKSSSVAGAKASLDLFGGEIQLEEENASVSFLDVTHERLHESLYCFRRTVALVHVRLQVGVPNDPCRHQVHLAVERRDRHAWRRRILSANGIVTPNAMQ